MEVQKDPKRFDKVMSAYLVLSGLLSDDDFIASARYEIIEEDPDDDDIDFEGNPNGLDSIPYPHKFVTFSDPRVSTFESALWNLVEDGRVPSDYRSAIRTLSHGQMDLFPGEYDSFGWLTGIFKTKVGMFVFG